MKKFLCAMALALLGYAGLSQQASAATVLNFDSPVGANAAFSIAHVFTVGQESNGTFGAAANLSAVSSLSASICTTSNCSGGALFSAIGAPLLSLFNAASGGFSALAAGNYFLVIAGQTTATPGFGSTYFATITLTPAVPVPPALLLFVTALGGLGATRYFRRKNDAAA